MKKSVAKKSVKSSTAKRNMKGKSVTKGSKGSKRVPAKPFLPLARGQVVLEERVSGPEREYFCCAVDGPPTKPRFGGRWVSESELLEHGVTSNALASVARGGMMLRKLESLRPADLWRAAEWWAPTGDGWRVAELEEAIEGRLGEVGCVVCQDEIAVFKAHPCNHRVICQTCLDVVQRPSDLPSICPICRRPLQGYRRAK
jgi:hypothetical protein